MKKITAALLQQMKLAGEKFAVLTAYDFTFARLMEQCGIEVVLVGDSLGNVIQGQESTVPVSVDDMCYHMAAVARGNKKSLLIADMPYMSYATSEQALTNATKLMQSGAQMVKLEGADWVCDIVELLTSRGIPVCGHIGLTPQSFHKLGGYKVQGKEASAADLMVSQAVELEEAGAELVVVECIPSSLGASLAGSVDIPVIGIGAGAETDAQVLVLHDMIGISQRLPKFSKNFLDGSTTMAEAITRYAEDVRSGAFPADEHGFAG